METLLSNNTAWPDMSLEAKQNKHKGGTHPPGVVCCKRSFFLIHFTCVLNKPSSSCHTDTPHHPFDFVKTLDIEKKKKKKKHETTRSWHLGTAHVTKTVSSSFSLVSWQVPRQKLLQQKEKKKKHRRQLRLTLVCRRFTLCTVFHIFFLRERTMRNLTLKSFLATKSCDGTCFFFFFLHTHDTHVHRKTRTNKAAPQCIDTAQAHRAQEVVHGLAFRKS